MENYISLKNEYFEILIPEEFKSYGQKVLEFSTNKLKEYLSFFKEENYKSTIKVAYFINQEDFIKRIKEISFPNAPFLPNWTKWARGCFCGGEIQILLDRDNPYDRFYTLAHETFHILFFKYVYEKNNWNRIAWLDESLAGNFDGTTENLIKHNIFHKLISKYLNNPNLPLMSELDLNNNRTTDYNTYELFKIVGRYLIETKTREELLSYINNIEEITKDSTTILEESLIFFSKKYHDELKKLNKKLG